MKILYAILVVISLILSFIFVGNVDNRADIIIEDNKSIEIEQPIFIESKSEEIEPEILETILKVDAGEDKILVLGEKITLKAEVNDESNISSYQWKEGKKVLSDKKSFSTLFSLGRHPITLTITDDKGRKAKDKVLISVGKYYIVKETSNKNNYIEYKSYNSEGNMTKNSIDYNNDGVIDRVYITNYDDMGRVIYESSDYNDDGELDSESHYSYDDNGNLIEYRYSFDDDEIERIYQYTYNDKNKKIKSILQEDDKEREIETFFYDKNGNNIKTLIDRDGDEVIDREKLYSYNDNSKITEEIEKDMEGNIKRKITKRYHENGKLLFYSDDLHGSGEPDITVDWNENGDMTHSQYKLKEDGTYMYEQNRTYTNSGKIKEIKGSWVFGEEEFSTYTYDKNENNILYIDKYDKEGKYLGKEYYHYDEHGNIIEIVNEDGEVLSSWEYEFIIGKRENNPSEE